MQGATDVYVQPIYDAAQAMLKKIETGRRWFLPDKEVWEGTDASLYLKYTDPLLDDDFAHEFVPFFLFDPHDELRIIKELEENTSWHGPEKFEHLSHVDCRAHEAASYLFIRAHGSTILMDEVRSIVRLRELTLEEANKLIQKERESCRSVPFVSLRALSAVCGMSLMGLLTLPLRNRFRDAFFGLLRKRS